MPCTLDGMHKLALVLGARSRYAFGDDLPLFRHETLQPLFIFIVDVDFLRITKAARPLLARHLALFLASWFPLHWFQSFILLLRVLV